MGSLLMLQTRGVTPTCRAPSASAFRCIAHRTPAASLQARTLPVAAAPLRSAARPGARRHPRPPRATEGGPAVGDKEPTSASLGPARPHVSEGGQASAPAGRGGISPDLLTRHAPARAVEDYLLYWLQANGSKGLEGDNAKASLDMGSGGSRGLVAAAAVPAGGEVMRVPIRLAVHAPEPDYPLYPGAPWSVHLAAKLLRLKAQGTESPWYPYVATLPNPMPTPLTFEWELMSQIQYSPAEEELHRFCWLVSDSYQQVQACGPEAVGNASREEWEWAMAIVHSRTLGIQRGSGPRPEEVGARLLVPQVDLLNHGGDEGPFSRAPVTATDNVRWDVETVDGAASMVVTATQDIQEGDELLLSYGERPNDHFFLYYGFVPLRNPHEDAELFEDLEAALEWHLEAFGDEEAEKRLALAESAYNNCVRGIEESSDGGAAKFEPKLKVVAGSRVDARLISAFAGMTLAEAGGGGEAGGEVAAQHLAAAESAVGRRCVQLLEQYATSLEDDLALLSEGGWESRRAHYSALLDHYQSVGGAYRALARKIVADPRPDRGPVGGGAVGEGGLEPARNIVVEFRAHKKMVLMDSALELTGTAPPPGFASWEAADAASQA